MISAFVSLIGKIVAVTKDHYNCFLLEAIGLFVLHLIQTTWHYLALEDGVEPYPYLEYIIPGISYSYTVHFKDVHPFENGK